MSERIGWKQKRRSRKDMATISLAQRWINNTEEEQ